MIVQNKRICFINPNQLVGSGNCTLILSNSLFALNLPSCLAILLILWWLINDFDLSVETEKLYMINSNAQQSVEQCTDIYANIRSYSRLFLISYVCESQIIRRSNTRSINIT